ncbi:MAG: hypothetical protein DRH37_00985 [Deltaproteobacteria bacterium]|nr:MAG: hypothetical protein B5M55_06665 [Desulfococcus sp. 4484_242]RLC32281.1 MAG: hypothetical protein DRH37_00985 [Deltaproteobacteria bacterium]
MIIDLKTLEHGPRRFHLVFKPEWWRADEENSPVLGLDGPLACQIDAVAAGARYIFDGRMHTCLFVRCDRCLETYRRNVDSQFRLFLLPRLPDPDRTDVELLEDDMDVHIIKGYKVDLNEMIREQIYLSLPMKSLCREDCCGLCPVCGINLNKERCNCQRGEGHPGFSKLKTLNLNGEH